DLMVEQGKITPHEAEQAKNEKLKFRQGNKKTVYSYPYFVDTVITEAEAVLKEQGFSREESQNLVYRGGLKIYTSLNREAQEKMEEVFADPSNFPPDKNGKQVEGAMVLIDQHTGEIQALVGGRNYSQLRPFNRATQAKRQPGSAIKPIAVYCPALEKGYTTATVLDDVPATFGSKTFYNYDNVYRGLIPMRTAVQWSVNTYAVKLLDRIGADYGFEFAKKLGITTLDPIRDRNLSLALGGITYGISPLEMAGAYAAIANQGIYIQPHTIRKIVDRNGEVLYDATPKRKVVMSPQTAYIMTDLLRTVVKAGTGQRAQMNRPVAGKTGTTENHVDAWFVGYTPEFVGVVWLGFDKEEQMPQGTWGSGYPLRIWKTVMLKATEGLPVRDFPQPGGLVRITICSKSGKLPNAFCPINELIQELFVKGTEPKQICDLHVQAEICADSGKLATTYCPHKISAVFLKRPPYSGNAMPLDAREALPTEVCPIHSSQENQEQMVRVKVCKDPRHNGVLYLANTPGLLETGGCPPEFVEEVELPAKDVPKLRCPLPDHQVKKIELNLNRLFNQGKKPENNSTNSQH
ncbi:MAG: transglycosylase domain-containing protein, partial [Thermacetogeniaceae bacterium]